MDIKLCIELVPESCFWSNLRSNLPKKVWDRLRKEIYQRAGYRCEICGGKGRKWPIECHEVWHYDDETHIQKLVGLKGLCPSCHSVKHFGLSRIRGIDDQLLRVNGWTAGETDGYISDVFEEWEARSQHAWKLDVSWLDTVGVKPPSLPDRETDSGRAVLEGKKIKAVLEDRGLDGVPRQEE